MAPSFLNLLHITRICEASAARVHGCAGARVGGYEIRNGRVLWVGKSRRSTELRDRVGEGPSSGAVTACQRCVSERRVEAIRTAIVGRCAVYGGRSQRGAQRGAQRAVDGVSIERLNRRCRQSARRR